MLSKEKTRELALYTKTHEKFHQTAFTRFEMIMHPIVSICLGLIFLNYEYQVVSKLIGINEDSSLKQSILEFKLIEVIKRTTFFNFCLAQAIFIKWLTYQLIGIIYDMEPLSANDDFWLYDSPINPTNVPSFIVFDKSDVPPADMVE